MNVVGKCGMKLLNRQLFAQNLKCFLHLYKPATVTTKNIRSWSSAAGHVCCCGSCCMLPTGCLRLSLSFFVPYYYFSKKLYWWKNPYFEAHFYDIIWCILMYFVSIFTGRTYQTLTSEWHPNCQLQSSLTKCTAQWCWLLFMPNGKPYRVNRKQ